MNNIMDLTLDDLRLAFRKAKIDAYYENGDNSVRKFIDYELQLDKNLNSLLLNILLDQADNDIEKSVGSFTYMIKSIKRDKESLTNFYYSNADEDWNNLENEQIEIQYRVIGQLEVEMHVIASLWIMKTGHKLERHLSENSYGCRLRRTNQKECFFKPGSTEYSEFDKGNFRPYFVDYKSWQNKGIDTLKHEIRNGKDVIAITLDIERFYHRVNPDFINSKEFLDLIGEADLYNDPYTILLLKRLEIWTKKVIDEGIFDFDMLRIRHCGIPIGYSASKIIANLLLFEFDKLIEKHIDPPYYGRYVDDIFLIINNTGEITNSEDFWNFIQKRIGTDKIEKVIDEDNYKLSIYYSKQSEVIFSPKKQRFFVLAGKSGEAFIESVQDSINENSSEWRMLPDTDKDLEALTKEMASPTTDSSEHVNSIRKSDGLSIQRLKFALHLRNFEAIVHSLNAHYWKDGLTKFLDLSLDFVVTPLNIDVYQKYYARLVRLAILSSRIDYAIKIINKINNSFDLLQSRSDNDVQFELCRKHINETLTEAIITGLNPDLLAGKKYEQYEPLFKMLNQSSNEIVKYHRYAIYSDWHVVPYKRFLIDDIEFRKSGLKHDKFVLDSAVLSNNSKLSHQFNSLLEFWYTYIKRTNAGFPSALFYYTRPFDTLELTLLFSDWLTNESKFDLLLLLNRIFGNPEIEGYIKKPRQHKELANYLYVDIKAEYKTIDRYFCLSNFYTSEDSWIADVRDDHQEPDTGRLQRLYRLINNVLRVKEKEIDYIVFPELSLPRSEISYVAKKLKNKGISLIAGVGYQKKELRNELQPLKGSVSNQLIYILNIGSSDKEQQISIIQEKVFPAIHEESNLMQVGGKILIPHSDKKYIINHDGLYLSGLICNDVLNINNRYPLRGEIDCLVLVEWNPDTETYDGLIKATANDLHCFVIQVNDRLYGDTRIRAPYKEHYMRDVVRIKGGEIDYFVVSKIEVESLREFQRDFRSSPKGKFKPVPTGYEISDERRHYKHKQ
ncbi:hypothetical protein IQ13_1382 [Lacibacter cauensis]|uniref:Reverse transcriptase (RNA-dependent DNA polymerase) n=1 Tax=Lacibacter cauensis TaxID=510947 RepID=A0A562SQI5_9BACT|nr:RNA-directed DNA polymerase [Lacibacter cauensis]TWI83274.1 hypothetical protein IQ13_1382 [Lacibacter cauensis]